MVFIQKDTYAKEIKNYIQSQHNATKIEQYNPADSIKPMKATTNLILNQRTASLKNAPIKDSDKKKAVPIPSYNKFKGTTVLPTFKKDLKHWGIVC